MGMKSLIYFAVAFLLAGFCQLARANSDLRNYQVKGGYITIDKNWGLAFDCDYKTDERREDFYYTYSNFGLIYKPLPDAFEVGFNYRQLYQQSEDDIWKPQNTPAMNVTVRGQFLNLNISNGTGLEYHRPENQKNIMRYANTCTVRLPLLSTAVKLQPYFAHNTFVDAGGDNFAGRGFSSGISLKLSRSVTSDFYYRWQAYRYGEVWKDFSVLGTSLRINF